MDIQQLKEMTNDYGKKFVGWIENNRILGVEITESNQLRNEFTVLYESQNGVYTAILPNKDDKNDGCCFFGDLQHFAMCYAAGKTGLITKWMGHKMIWPAWYTEKELFDEWKRHYDSMMQKYS